MQNAMISNIVHVTKIPRKKVLKWFEDKRGEDGVPDQRQPYQRYVYETFFRSQTQRLNLDISSALYTVVAKSDDRVMGQRRFTLKPFISRRQKKPGRVGLTCLHFLPP